LDLERVSRRLQQSPGTTPQAVPRNSDHNMCSTTTAWNWTTARPATDGGVSW